MNNNQSGLQFSKCLSPTQTPERRRKLSSLFLAQGGKIVTICQENFTDSPKSALNSCDGQFCLCSSKGFAFFIRAKMAERSRIKRQGDANFVTECHSHQKLRSNSRNERRTAVVPELRDCCVSALSESTLDKAEQLFKYSSFSKKKSNDIIQLRNRLLFARHIDLTCPYIKSN